MIDWLYLQLFGRIAILLACLFRFQNNKARAKRFGS
jgi:hypothetical protein